MILSKTALESPMLTFSEICWGCFTSDWIKVGYYSLSLLYVISFAVFTVAIKNFIYHTTLISLLIKTSNSRKTIRHIVLHSIGLLVLITTSLYVQAQVISVDQITPGHITDQNITQPLQKDWNTRNPKIQNQDVKWYQTGDSYYGTYSYNNQNYMSLYDPDGKYVETLRKSDWNSSIPNPVRSSFNLSTYRTQEVIEYWEVIDPGKKGYYMELSDSEGRTSRFWVSEKGDFSATPPARAKLKH